MTQYLVAIHHPDDYDPSAEDEAMASSRATATPLTERMRQGIRQSTWLIENRGHL